MRFSSIFQLPSAQRAAEAQHALTEPVPAEFLPSDAAPLVPLVASEPPPDDLDQRVRLIGEWQLGEDD